MADSIAGFEIAEDETYIYLSNKFRCLANAMTNEEAERLAFALTSMVRSRLEEKD